MDKQKIKSIVIFTCFLIVIVILTIVLWPFISSLTTEEKRIELKNYIDSLGIGGWFLMLGIQILQIVIAFLPGEPIEIVMGAMFGSIGGLFTCLLGILIGSIIVYILGSLIGKPFIKLFVQEEDFKKYKFLNDPTKVDMMVFLLFFIPGTPKDALTYLSPFIPIKKTKFFIISTLARIPSVITSTIMGNELIEGNYITTIIVFAITAVISIAGIVFNNYYTKKKNQTN